MPRYRFLDCELDPANSRLLRGSEELPLQPQVFDFLHFLVKRPGQLVTRKDLHAAVWPDVHVTDEALTQLVRKLRKSLQDDAKEPRFVETVLKRGYRFLPPVETLPDAPAPPSTPTEVPRPPSPPTSPARNDGASPHVLAPEFLPTGEYTSPRIGVRSGTPRSSPPRKRPDVPQAAPPPRSGRSAVLRRGPYVLGAVGLVVLVLALLGLWTLYRPKNPAPPDLLAVRLTFRPEKEQDPSFAPDGVTYVFARNDPSGGRLDIWLSRLQGSGEVQLTRGPADDAIPRVSPDGRMVSFFRLAPGETIPSIWGVPLLGGDEQLLVRDATSGAWSPDGNELAVVREVADGHRLLLRHRLDDGSETVITNRAGDIYSVAWSPDGATIAFSDETRLYVVPADGGEVKTLGERAEYMRSIAFSADGAAILADPNWSGRADLWRVPLDGSEPLALTRGGNYYNPAPSPDGKHILAVRESARLNLMRFGPAGSAESVHAKSTLSCIDIHPDGHTVAYCDDDAGLTRVAVGVLDLDTSATRLLGEGRCPSFSPDGTQVAYPSVDPENPGVRVVDLATGAENLLAAAAPTALHVGWSPDGTRIAVATDDPVTGPALVEITLDDGDVRALANGRFRAPSYSPDGRSIAVAGENVDGSGTFVYDRGTGVIRRFTPASSWQAAPIWSSDSQRVTLLLDERTQPVLGVVDLTGNPIGEAQPLPVVPTASWWGVFEARPLGADRWLMIQSEHEADIFSFEEAAAP